jgi:hypothetical protein
MYSCQILTKLEFFLGGGGQIGQNALTQISMKIRPVGAELFHEDGRTDRNDETNRRFSQLCEKRLKPDVHYWAYSCIGTIIYTHSNAYTTFKMYQYDTKLTFKH